MNKNILTLVEVSRWANEHFRSVLKNLPFNSLLNQTPYGTILDMIVHIFSSVNFWLDRTEGIKHPQRLTSDLFTDNESLLKTWRNIDERLHNKISKMNSVDFDRTIDYIHKDGETYITTMTEIVYHITLHGYYHRGQLALLLRQYNLNPAPPTDIMVYFRENKLYLK